MLTTGVDQVFVFIKVSSKSFLKVSAKYLINDTEPKRLPKAVILVKYFFIGAKALVNKFYCKKNWTQFFSTPFYIASKDVIKLFAFISPENKKPLINFYLKSSENRRISGRIKLIKGYVISGGIDVN